MIKYLSLTQVLHVAEVVTGLPFETIKKVAQINLIDSAIAAPKSSFIGLDPYPELSDKAAILAFHLVRNHPLPDGNKRLAFLCAYEFCWINGYELEFDVEEAEQVFFGLAAGLVNIEDLRNWINKVMRKI